jgi:hypothetical protein
MSGTFPTSPSFVATNFRINNTVQKTETFGGKIRRVGLGTSFYTFTVKFPPMTRAQAGPIVGFIGQQYGMMESFQILLPNESYPVANYSYNSPYIPKPSATFAAGVKNITITGCFPLTAVLNAGDYFKFSNHSKVYMCSTNCTSDVSGNATLYFSGSLMKEVGTAVTLTVKAVPFTVLMSSEAQEYESGLGRMVNMSLDLREEVNPL